ncbi:putative fucosyltransferase-like protein [Hibiscus syriacus]|uniref:putative fucosyltransferase-like protein n=1 Tax=Hibiscus syriacus TaxID=106335 RepID=UPI001920EF19|nr:putative fucosyltransferase-like protein [Hibiscus syriacus]
MPLLLALLVIAEIGFVGRFDSLPAMFRESRSSGRLKVAGARNSWIRALGGHRNLTCEEWLEREDVVVYSRDFSDDPVLVYCQKPELKRPCAVGCKMGPHPSKKPNAIISQHPKAEAPSVLLSMESSAYYSEINIARARRWVITIYIDLLVFETIVGLLPMFH